MKVIVFVWRDPNGNLQNDQLETGDWSIKTDGPWCKVIHKTNGIRRIVPAHHICLIDFGESEEKPNIIRPKVFEAS